MVQMQPPRPVTASSIATPIPIAISPAPPTPVPFPTSNNHAPSDEVNTIDIIFEKELPDELSCPICEQALRFAHKTACGHLFCEECLQNMETCKVCNAAIAPGSAKPDKSAMRKVQALEVLCSWKDQGCDWKGALKSLQDHAMACKFREIVCNRGCGQIYAKLHEERHLNEECGKRGVKCPHCQKEFPAKAIDVHNKLCALAVVSCPNQCGLVNIPREQMREHLPMCPKRGNGCPFSEFGCSYAGEKEALQRHISEEPIRHLTFLCDGVIELKVSLLLVSFSIQMLLTHMQLQMDTMTKAMQALEQKSEVLEKLYGAQLVWRIDNFRQKFNEAKSGAKSTIFSAPFMSGRHGYKLMCSVCPYGDGPVYLTIMRGEFDALLTWPFLHKVTFTLMDQNRQDNRANNKSYVVKPVTSRENRVFLERPVSERNAAFGAQRFCDLTQLESYIVDDAIFIKVNIDLDSAAI